jgi:ribonuclease-3
LTGQRFKPRFLKTPPLSRERKRQLSGFEKNFGGRFRSLELLNLAFSHRSFANESENTIDNNEKLEFLGDAVLGLAVSELLFRRLRDRTEGEMARVKSFVVSERSLAKIAQQLRVDTYLLIGKGEEYSGGRTKRAILADAMEAAIGAFYLDSGFSAARRVVDRLFTPEIEVVLADRHHKDYKTLLQEYVQKKYRTYPRYSVVQRSGPDHDRTFWIKVIINDQERGKGKGKNKKEAEQEAAAQAYRTLTEEEES